MLRAALALVFACAAGAPAAADARRCCDCDCGAVRAHTRAPEPTRSEQLRSTRRFIPAGDPRPGLLLNPAPYPAGRVDGPGREELGRIWASRSPVGSRTPIRESVLTLPGPANYGAPHAAHADVIFVQPTEIDTVIAISPWQEINDHTLRQILRGEKNLGRTRHNPSSARLLSELQAAQHQWLREQGYIQTVRTHVNPANQRRHTDTRAEEPRREIQPRAIIRVQPAAPPPPAARTADASPPPAADLD